MLGQLLLELGGQEVVDERVEAAVQARHAERNRVKLSDGPTHFTVSYDALGYHEIKQEVDVVWGEAEEEDTCTHPDHAQGLSCVAGGLFVAIPLSQRVHY